MKENYQILGEFLPVGSVKTVAKRLGKSESYVSRVKKGKLKNPKILEALIREAEKYKELTDRMKLLGV